MKRTLPVIILLVLLSTIVHAGVGTWDETNSTELAGTVIGAGSSAEAIITLGSVTVAGTTPATIVLTGDTVTSSTMVSNVDTTDLEAGFSVSGTGIAAGTTIASITDATSLVLSAAATADGTGVSLTFSDYTAVSVSTSSTDRIHKGMRSGDKDNGDQVTGLRRTRGHFRFAEAKEAGTSDYTLYNTYDTMLVQVSINEDSWANGAVVKFYASIDNGTTWDTAPFVTHTFVHSAATVAWSYRLTAYLYPKVKVVVSNPATESGDDDDITATVTFAGHRN